MKTGIGRFGALSAMAATAMWLAAPMPAAASDGTIFFSGAIVAPSLAISAAPALAPVGARVDAAGARLAQTGSAVALTFSAAPGVATGADVALQVNNGATARDALVERFVDSGGRVSNAASDGHYRVGRDGGMLSLAPRNATPDTRVTVVVIYD
jgi:predicted Zn-dependent protease